MSFMEKQCFKTIFLNISIDSQSEASLWAISIPQKKKKGTVEFQIFKSGYQENVEATLARKCEQYCAQFCAAASCMYYLLY